MESTVDTNSPNQLTIASISFLQFTTSCEASAGRTVLGDRLLHEPLLAPSGPEHHRHITGREYPQLTTATTTLHTRREEYTSHSKIIHS